MKKNILMFLSILTFIAEAHTLKLYRSDLLVSKDKNVLVSEVSQIVLDNDILQLILKLKLMTSR